MTTALAFDDAGHGYDVFGLHPPTLRRVFGRARRFADVYFRPSSHGSDSIPRSGPAILVANHGGALPIDGALLCMDVERRTGRILRPIGDRFIPVMPLVSTLFARIGAVSGTRTNVVHLLERGELIAIWPEGSAGIGKPIRRRYQIDQWRVGHAELAMRHRAPVIPVAILGSEESWPVIARLRRFHAFGAPFLPVPITPFPLPIRFHIHYGTPITLDDDDPDDPVAVARAATRIRDAVVEMIREAREVRGGRLL